MEKVIKDANSPKNVIESIDMGSLAIVIPERKDEDKTSMVQQGLPCPTLAVEEVKLVQLNVDLEDQPNDQKRQISST